MTDDGVRPGADPRPTLLILVLSDITRDPRVRKQVRLFADRYAVTTCSFGAPPDGVVEHLSLGAEARGWPNDSALGRTLRCSAIRGSSTVG